MWTFDLGSAFNFAAINQVNYQLAQNTANNSAGAQQGIEQNASNSAVVVQVR
jgi:hypothetical protein